MNYFIYTSHHFTPHGRYGLLTGITEVTGSNPVEALTFSDFFFPIALIGKLTTMIILHFHLQPRFKYDFFRIYFTTFVDVARCCGRLARFVQQWCSRACALVRFSIPNMSLQEGGQTHATCCAQQCRDMLC